MPANSKELVRTLFAGKTVSRPPFIPYIATAAAQLMQVPVRQMFSDPTVLANSLQASQRLFRYDGMVILFDPTLEAEACGCQLAWPDGQPPAVVSPVLSAEKDTAGLDVSEIETKGRIPAVLEAARRLTQTVGSEVALLGVITGPVTLSRQIGGKSIITTAGDDDQGIQKLTDLAGKIALKQARAYGELKFDAVLLADEDLAGVDPARYAQIEPTLKTLRNLVNFYDARLIIVTRAVPAERLPALFRLPADGFSLGNPVSAVRELASATGALFSGCIPTSALLGSPHEVERATLELLEKGGGTRFFIASEWEVERGTPAMNIHKVMQVLTSAPAQ